MLSAMLRRAFLRTGTLLSAQRLPTRVVSPNQPLTWRVHRSFETATSDINSEPTTGSEPDEKPTSTGGETRSSKNKTEGTTKRSAKKTEAKEKKIVIPRKDLPPKHPSNGYTLWMSDWSRTQDKADGPEGAQNKMKRGAQTWNTLPESDKKQYKDKYENLKTEYNRRMEEWRENVDPAILGELNRRRVAKGRLRIRGPSSTRPLSGYLRYFKEVKENIPQTEENHQGWFVALCKQAGSQWKAMSEDEKAKYNDLAKAELAAWHEKQKAKGQAK